MFSEVSTEEQHICVCKYGLLTCNRKLDSEISFTSSNFNRKLGKN